MPKAESRVSLDTEELRIREWRLHPGGATDRHKLDCDLITVPLTRGLLRIQSGGSERLIEAIPGAILVRDAPSDHHAVNVGDAVLSFIEIEVKASVRKLISA